MLLAYAAAVNVLRIKSTALAGIRQIERIAYRDRGFAQLVKIIVLGLHAYRILNLLQFLLRLHHVGQIPRGIGTIFNNTLWTQGRCDWRHPKGRGPYQRRCYQFQYSRVQNWHIRRIITTIRGIEQARGVVQFGGRQSGRYTEEHLGRRRREDIYAQECQ